MDLTLLKKFLIDSNAAGYASGEEKKWIKEEDNSTSIVFISGDFKMHDNYFGGEPYGGREAVFYQGKPVWIMTYYGWVEQEVSDLKMIYSFLQEALKNMPDDAPFRGPKNFRQDDFEYQNSWQGELDRFSGEEKILKNGKEIYRAFYRGGLVDQRPE